MRMEDIVLERCCIAHVSPFRRYERSLQHNRDGREYDIVILIHLTRPPIVTMTRKTITITEQMDDWVKAQIDSGRYGNDSEYFRDLIRRDQARCEAEIKLGEMIDEAEASGLGDRSARDVWDEAERQVSATGG
jgi:antitoxin ParD1/3/4